LDDGIGDTLVLIDKPNGIGNAEELSRPRMWHYRCKLDDTPLNPRLVDFRRIVVLQLPQ
jgi:hypothetical protein